MIQESDNLNPIFFEVHTFLYAVLGLDIVEVLVQYWFLSHVIPTLNHILIWSWFKQFICSHYIALLQKMFVWIECKQSIQKLMTQARVCPTPIIPPNLDKSAKGPIVSWVTVTSTFWSTINTIPYLPSLFWNPSSSTLNL